MMGHFAWCNVCNKCLVTIGGIQQVWVLLKKNSCGWVGVHVKYTLLDTLKNLLVWVTSSPTREMRRSVHQTALPFEYVLTDVKLYLPASEDGRW